MEPLIREVPARWVAAIETELVQEELPDFLESAISGLLLFASAHHAPRPTTSTAEWPAFAIYNGIINSRRPIRVEAALTLPSYLAPEGLIRVREEPQHREAYLPMTREQLLGPEAARIYDALGGWIAANASPHPELAPRDVYIADVMAARLGDHVCDAAFPFVTPPQG